MKKHTDLLEPDKFYHVFNRGINGEDLFKEHRNYPYFLQKIANYILPIADVYAYCLMKNHFHLCIRTRTAVVIMQNCHRQIAKDGVAGSNAVLHTPGWLLGNQFASLFKSYAQGINQTYKRTGQLFEETFRRIAVEDDTYLRWLIFYIHSNPCLYGFINNFTAYPNSSYQSMLSNSQTQLSREKVLNLFDGKAQFELFARGQLSDEMMEKILLE